MITATLLFASILVGAQTGSDSTLRVASFNIRYGTAADGENSWRFRRDAVIEVIDSLDSDIVGIQEGLRDQLDFIRERLPRYGELGVGRNDGAESGEYAAILYRTDRIGVLESGTFWFSATPDRPGSVGWGTRIPRICTWARLRDLRSGRSFYVFNVHWDHASQTSRDRSARLLLERIAEYSNGNPVIVTGDFNAGPGNSAVETLRSADFRDSFSGLHPRAVGTGTFHDFAGSRSGEKIDAVLVDDAWVVTAAAIVRWHRSGQYPSDHFPVVADLLLGPGDPP